MPASDASSTGASGFTRKKKKQAKEERDKLKQVEKKKRRLEKAIATAAAIRLELEKKKQKRKEEEQRLDEEGAALAESVARQVLVGDDSDVDAGDAGPDVHLLNVNRCDKNANIDFRNVRNVHPSSSTCKEILVKPEASSSCTYGNFEKDHSKGSQGLPFCDIAVCQYRTLTIRDDVKANTERAKAAELAAGMAAAQAVAALRIAEEARAEAEAAKRVAEAAINHVSERKQVLNVSFCQASFHPGSLDMKRDELRTRMEEAELHLKEKAQEVLYLEQNLEDMTHCLLHLKERMLSVGEIQGESLEWQSADVSESSIGTVDQ